MASNVRIALVSVVLVLLAVCPTMAAPYTDPAGFTIDVPSGFKPESLDGGTRFHGVRVENAKQHSAAILYLDVPPASGTPAELANDLFKVATQTAQDVRALRPPVVRTNGGAYTEVREYAVRVNGMQKRVALLVYVAGKACTVYSISAPADAFAAVRPQLLKVVDSFRFGARTAAPTATAQAPPVQFVDPTEQAFSTSFPAGWRVTQGGTLRPNAFELSNFLNAVSPNGDARVVLMSPYLLTLIAPNQLLSMGGFHEGSWYSAYNTRSLVMRPMRPDQFLSFLTRYDRNLSSFRVGKNQNVPSLSGYRDFPDLRLVQDSGWVEVEDTQKGMRGYALVQVFQVLTNHTMWYGHVTMWLAKPGAEAEALAGFEQMMQTFKMNPEWEARQSAFAARNGAIAVEAGQVVNGMIIGSGNYRNAVMSEVSQWQHQSTKGTTTVRDPTGTVREVSNGYNYYWGTPGGTTVVGTNTARPPGPNMELLQQTR